MSHHSEMVRLIPVRGLTTPYRPESGRLVTACLQLQQTDQARAARVMQGCVYLFKNAENLGQLAFDIRARMHASQG